MARKDSREHKLAIKDFDTKAFKDRFQARRPTIQLDFSHYYQEPRKASAVARKISANVNNGGIQKLPVLLEKRRISLSSGIGVYQYYDKNCRFV